MSELINNMDKRKELLKHLILQLHKGEKADAVRQQLLDLLGKVPYGEVVEVEQELISEGLPQEEIIKLCDVHSQALKGVISEDEQKEVPAGHPVHTFKEENKALQLEMAQAKKLFEDIEHENIDKILQELKNHFNNLTDVEKHYSRKENLLFPYLEKLGITGPPTVMWGKHDEIREQLKGAHEALTITGDITKDDVESLIDFVIKPTLETIEEMIYKEENILFPMCLDRLTESDWYEIYNQTMEIGYCLYEPKDSWKPEGKDIQMQEPVDSSRIQTPSGSFTVEELVAILNTLPIDITFVDRDDKVKFFSQNKERIFHRMLSVLNRDVKFCHPPSSVGIVEKIINDFKNGSESRAPFWIQMGDRFIHIEYFALRNKKGEYLGTLEVSQDLTSLRQLEGEQRLLSYADKEENHEH